MKTLAETIKARRAELGLTLRELAERTGLSHSNIRKMETDDVKPKKSTLEILEKSLVMSKGSLTMLAGYLPDMLKVEEVKEISDEDREKLEDRIAKAKYTLTSVTEGTAFKELESTIVKLCRDALDQEFTEMSDLVSMAGQISSMRQLVNSFNKIDDTASNVFSNLEWMRASSYETR